MLQKTRYKNTIGGYYDQRFAKKSIQPSRVNFKMISSVQVNDTNNQFLKNEFNTKKKSQQFKLNNRIPNSNINEKFSLQINTKSKEIIDEDFCMEDSDNEDDFNNLNDDDDDDDIDFDLLLNNKTKESKFTSNKANKANKHENNNHIIQSDELIIKKKRLKIN